MSNLLKGNPQFYTLDVIVPDEFLNETGKKHRGKVKAKVTVSYAYDGETTDSYLYASTAVSHRHINWNESLYNYLNNEAVNDAKLRDAKILQHN